MLSLKERRADARAEKLKNSKYAVSTARRHSTETKSQALSAYKAVTAAA